MCVYSVINLSKTAAVFQVYRENRLHKKPETTGLPESERGKTSSQTGSRALSFCMLGSRAEVDVMEVGG